LLLLLFGVDIGSLFVAGDAGLGGEGVLLCTVVLFKLLFPVTCYLFVDTRMQLQSTRESGSRSTSVCINTCINTESERKFEK